MYIFPENGPINQLSARHGGGMADFVRDAKNKPLVLAGELFAFAMMVIGTVTSISAAYDLFFQIGFNAAG